VSYTWFTAPNAVSNSICLVPSGTGYVLAPWWGTEYYWYNNGAASGYVVWNLNTGPLLDTSGNVFTLDSSSLG